MKVEKLHDFHDLDYVRNWAETKSPTPERMQLFNDIASIIKQNYTTNFTILEIGSGPGFLVEFMLNQFENITYYGLDFSAEMIQIAKERLGKNADNCKFIQADLTQTDWKKNIPTPPNVIITTWTLHDLFNKENIKNVYKNVFDLLSKNGHFLNGDFIKPNETQHEYEGGRITINEHFELFKSVGFQQSSCLKKYEVNIENPTTTNNYVLFKVVK